MPNVLTVTIMQPRGGWMPPRSKGAANEVSELLGREGIYSTGQGMEGSSDALPAHPSHAVPSLLPRILCSLGDDNWQNNNAESRINDPPTTPSSASCGRRHGDSYRGETSREDVKGPKKPSGRCRLADRQHQHADRRWDRTNETNPPAEGRNRKSFCLLRTFQRKVLQS